MGQWFQFIVTTVIAVLALRLGWKQFELQRRSMSPGSVYRNDPWIRRYWPIAATVVLNLLLWVPFVYTLTTAVEPATYLTRWGGGNTNCAATINMGELVAYAETDQVALACWLQDLTVDVRLNTAFTVSNLLAIDQKILERGVTAPWSEAMMKGALILFQRVAGPNSFLPNTQTEGQVVVNFQLILLPKNSDVRRVSKLADIEPLGGRILGHGVSHTRTIAIKAGPAPSTK